MAEIILHHYPRSPFAEKVRLALGFKGASWRSVDIPIFAPKPDLVPLTGGYRRTPVMQIGADIFCDTRIILREIEKLLPKPSLFGAGGGSLVSAWADGTLFLSAVGLVMGTFADRIPAAMREDRFQFTNGLFDADRFKQDQPALRATFRAYTRWLEEALSDQRAFFAGAAADIGDFSLYHPLWFVRLNLKDLDLLGDCPATNAWFARMESFGHGTPSPLESGQALAIAREAEPRPVEQGSAEDMSGCRPGQPVIVAASDYGRDPVAGRLVAIDETRIVLARNDDKVGTVHVHFPRAGFDVTAQ